MEERFRYLWQDQETEKKSIESDNTTDDIAERERIAFEKGYQQAKHEIEQELVTTEDAYSLLLQNINNNIGRLISDKTCAHEKSLYQLAIAIGEKLSSIVLEERHLEIVKGFINNIVSTIKEHPPITIKVNDKLVETLQKELHDYKIIGDMKLAASDCVITWEDGTASNIWQEKKTEIEEILLKKREVNDD